MLYMLSLSFYVLKNQSRLDSASVSLTENAIKAAFKHHPKAVHA